MSVEMEVRNCGIIVGGLAALFHLGTTGVSLFGFVFVLFSWANQILQRFSSLLPEVAYYYSCQPIRKGMQVSAVINCPNFRREPHAQL